MPVSPGKLQDWVCEQPDRSDFRDLLRAARKHFAPRPVPANRLQEVLKRIGD